MAYNINNPPLFVEFNNIYSINFNTDTTDISNTELYFFNQTPFGEVVQSDYSKIDDNTFRVNYGFGKSIKNDFNVDFKRVNRIESVIRDVKISTSDFKDRGEYDNVLYPAAGVEPLNDYEFMTYNDGGGIELDPELVTSITINKTQKVDGTDTVFQYDKYLIIREDTGERFINYTFQLIDVTPDPDYYNFDVEYIPEESKQSTDTFTRGQQYDLLTRNRLQSRQPSSLGLILPINLTLHGHTISINNANSNEVNILKNGKEAFWETSAGIGVLPDLDREIYNYYYSNPENIIQLTDLPKESSLLMSFNRNINNLRAYYQYDTFSNVPKALGSSAPFIPLSFEYEYFGLYQISISYGLRVYPDYTSAPANGLREPEEITMANIKKMMLGRDKDKEDKKEKKDKKKKKKKGIILEQITGKVSPELYKEILENILEL